jgi:transposase
MAKFNEDRRARIIEALASGLTITAAARLAGISRETYYEWLDRGRQAPTGRYREFVEAVGRAEAEAEQRATAQIAVAANDDWRAAAWWLERRVREYRKTERHEVTGRDGEALRVALKWAPSESDAQPGQP